MSLFVRCCTCGDKQSIEGPFGVNFKGDPCSGCGGERYSLKIGKEKPDWFDEDNETFVARYKEPPHDV